MIRRLLAVLGLAGGMFLLVPLPARADNCTGTADTQNCMVAVNAVALATALAATGAVIGGALTAADISKRRGTARDLTPPDAPPEQREAARRSNCAQNLAALQKMADDITSRVQRESGYAPPRWDEAAETQHLTAMRQADALVRSYAVLLDRFSAECSDCISGRPPDPSTWKTGLCAIRRRDLQRAVTEYERRDQLIDEIEQARKKLDAFKDLPQYLHAAGVAQDYAERWLFLYSTTAAAPRAFWKLNRWLLDKVSGGNYEPLEIVEGGVLGIGGALTVPQAPAVVPFLSSITGLTEVSIAAASGVCSIVGAGLGLGYMADVYVGKQADSIMAGLRDLQAKTQAARDARDQAWRALDQLVGRYAGEPLALENQMRLYQEIETLKLFCTQSCGAPPMTNLAFPRGVPEIAVQPLPPPVPTMSGSPSMSALPD